MAALNASVKQAKEARGESEKHATVHEMNPRKKKTAGRKPRSAWTTRAPRTRCRASSGCRPGTLHQGRRVPTHG